MLTESALYVERMSWPTDAWRTRVFRLSGLAIWVFSGLPGALILWRASALNRQNFVLWTGAFLLFGTLFWICSRRLVDGKGPALSTAMLLIQGACALFMYHLICTGFEALLLVIVAAEIGLLLAIQWALVWIVAQSLVMAWLATLHYSYPNSLWWAAGTLGFSIFAALTTLSTAREAKAKVDLSRALAELSATQELLAGSARMAERLRISRELHDLVGHHLTALSLNLEVASHLVDDKAQAPVQKAQQTAKQLLADVRQVVGQLREEDGYDVATALARLAEGVWGLNVHLSYPEALSISDSERAQTLIRCIQETITNAIRHASAQNLWIEVTVEDGILNLTAKDDGCGVESIEPGNGLKGMRERLERAGGKMKLSSSPGEGFTLSIVMPTSASL